MRGAWLAVAVLLITGCAQVLYYVPDQPVTGVILTGWPRNRVTVDVQDFRADDREGSEKLVSILRQSVNGALSAPEAADGLPYRLRISVVEHRSFFTADNWNARTRLRATLVEPAEKVVKTYTAIGADSRSDLWGYRSAKDAGHDSFRQAVSDLLSQLDAEPLAGIVAAPR